MELPEECSAFQPSEYVKVTGGSFKGYYAVVTESSYGDELEINYFEKKEKWWTLKENDLDSTEINDLQKVTKVQMVHYLFKSSLLFL